MTRRWDRRAGQCCRRAAAASERTDPGTNPPRHQPRPCSSSGSARLDPLTSELKAEAHPCSPAGAARAFGTPWSPAVGGWKPLKTKQPRGKPVLGPTAATRLSGVTGSLGTPLTRRILATLSSFSSRALLSFRLALCEAGAAAPRGAEHPVVPSCLSQEDVRGVQWVRAFPHLHHATSASSGLGTADPGPAAGPERPVPGKAERKTSQESLS